MICLPFSVFIRNSFFYIKTFSVLKKKKKGSFFPAFLKHCLPNLRMKNWANYLDMLKTMYPHGPNYWKGKTEWEWCSLFSSVYFSCHSRTWLVSPVSQNDPQFLCSPPLPFPSLLAVSRAKSEIKHCYYFCWQVEPRAQILNNSRMKMDWRYQEGESTVILTQVCSTCWKAKMQSICPPCSSAVRAFLFCREAAICYQLSQSAKVLLH